MKLVDVTLRDGGFTCDFNWPMEFAQEYYELLSELDVDLIELGYWKQTAKSKNRFFNLHKNITPSNVLKFKEISFINCGLSKQKILYIKNYLQMAPAKIIRKQNTGKKNIDITNNL